MQQPGPPIIIQQQRPQVPGLSLDHLFIIMSCHVHSHILCYNEQHTYGDTHTGESISGRASSILDVAGPEAGVRSPDEP